MDDPEKIKSIAGITRIWIEEATELDLEDFRQLNLRLRGADNLQMSLTFNPISVKHWLYTEFFENKKDNATIFKTTYLDNKFIDEAYITELKSLEELDEGLYNVYVLGKFGVVRTGQEWASKFRYSIHVKECSYNPNLPIHLTLDFNSKPYASALVNQIDLSGQRIKYRTVKEYALKHPRNSTESICRDLLDDFEYMGIESIFYYGDSTGKNDVAKKRAKENEHHYDVVEDELKDYLTHNSDRVMSSNPSVAKTNRFYKHLLSGNLGIDVEIDPSCVNFISDLENCKEDANGGILKPKVKDKETGAIYEKYGHHLDSHRYCSCSVFENQFEKC